MLKRKLNRRKSRNLVSISKIIAKLLSTYTVRSLLSNSYIFTQSEEKLSQKNKGNEGLKDILFRFPEYC